jgi:hypothetical protein
LKPEALAGSWAPNLGSSSGFRLATAHERAEPGPSPCPVHRNRRSAPLRSGPEFDKIHAMETRRLDWTQNLLPHQLFADDARVSGRTRQGKHVDGGAHLPGAAS